VALLSDCALEEQRVCAQRVESRSGSADGLGGLLYGVSVVLAISRAREIAAPAMKAMLVNAPNQLHPAMLGPRINPTDSATKTANPTAQAAIRMAHPKSRSPSLV